MIWDPFGLISGILALLIFGCAYAYFIHKLGDKLEGFTSLAVVVGVSVTLLISAFFIGWLNALVVLAFFAASGTPMVVGDIATYIRRRERAKQLARQDLKGGADGH